MGIVYKTTCLVNNHIYIGKSKYNNPLYIGSGFILKKAIRKYGKNNFRKEIIEECLSEEYLNNREKYWIKEYNSIFPNGYNLVEGGTGGDTFTNSLRKEQTRIKISKATTGINNPMFGRKKEKAPMFGKRGKDHPAFGRTGEKSPVAKPIIQLSTKNEIIKIWDSAKQIEDELGFDDGNIGLVCKNKRKIANGYHWQYV
jgi:group I intron endonuclease